MRTADWARSLGSFPALREIFQAKGRSTWRSIATEARPPLLAAAFLASPTRILIIAASYERALQWQAKLQICGIDSDDIRQLPSGSSSLFEDSAPEHIALSDRLGALRSLVDDKPRIVVGTAQAALERTLPRDVLLDAFLYIESGRTLDLQKSIEQLQHLGYELQEPVRQPGQFSLRGGILDIFATGHDVPHRVELFGDVVESVRTFDANSQRSINKVPSLRLAPSRETLYTGVAGGYKELILGSMQREASALDAASAARLSELVAGDAEALGSHQYFDRLDLYRPLLHPESGCAIDLLGKTDLLVLDEPLELESIIARAEEELAQALAARSERGEILHSTANDFILPPEHLDSHKRTLSLTSMNALPSWLSAGVESDVHASSLEPYRGRSEALTHTIRNWREADFKLVFSTEQPQRARAVLAQIDIHPIEAEDASAFEPSAKSILVNGNLGGGFALTDQKIALITDAELFGVARLRMPQRRFLEGVPLATVLDLKPGDYVVHIHFGIGVFRGLVKRQEQGVEKEFLFIEYKHPDKLFVPADQLDRIQKYLNPGDEHPRLNRLTGGEWQKTVSKAKEDAKEFARELVKLYAQRKAVGRRSYGPDTPFQAEMESTFPWVETPSQMQAIKDTKRDLQQNFPMDRLVCGDVGFGKTEVAVRAAFKTVQSGRQVAVLCPTTILSEQHFRTFTERLEPFGVRIEIANRFRSASERKSISEGLKVGTVDIVIGTHALLGKDIQFKNLGLVVIDEEQRFGVKQKEMLKQLRTEVDVLTLSATPIPRTLSMALMDIRQMSLINDPPPGRLPIRTYLRPYSGEMVREAILREIARGGQVFYVYNRVESIHHIAERIRMLVPTARIGIGHGQMTEKELEPVMLGFIKGEIDVLLSTTIIESGLDIPNANTLIVENADRLGLAQLYQLRGRVGRSDRQAYAYLLFGTGKELTESATARLQALQEFSTLGSGYSLAFRDLQIRGAGELLGAKQHGSMVAVGFELFTQMITEAVALLKQSVDGGAEPAPDAKDPLASLEPLPTIEAPIVAILPDNYIRDQAQRLFYYQKIMTSRDEASLGEVQAEIEDRYGRPPVPVQNVFLVLSARILARALGLDKIDARGGRLSVTFRDLTSISPRVFTLMHQTNRDCYLSRDSFVWPYGGDPLAALKRMFDAFQAAHRQITEAKAALGV